MNNEEFFKIIVNFNSYDELKIWAEDMLEAQRKVRNELFSIYVNEDMGVSTSDKKERKT